MTTMTENSYYGGTEYNGYTNRETWATALYINNDQGMQESAVERLQNYSTHNQPDALKDWFEELIEELLTVETALSMVKDIGSLYRVNWAEIASNLLAD